MALPATYRGCLTGRITAVAFTAFVTAACGTAESPASPAPTQTSSATSASGAPSAAAESTAPAAPATDTRSPTAQPSPAIAAIETAGGPAAREDHTWTLAGGTTAALLFGGRDGSSIFGDLWSYDLADDTWTQLEPPPGPAPRFGHEAAWVDGVGLVVFAGQAGPQFFNDLWAYDLESNAWRQLPASGDAPIPRYGTCAAIGPDDRLWVSHGFTTDGTRFSDTRAYDFATGAWTEETPADGDRPVERCLHACWWTESGDMALYAGQTTGLTALGDRWALRAGGWTREDGVLPPDRNLYAHARVSGGTLIVGGQALDGSYLADAWILPDDARDAVPLELGAASVPSRAGATLVVDVERGRILMFGGRDDAGSHGNTWQLVNIPLGD